MGRWEEMMYDLPTDNSKIDWYPGCRGCLFAEDDGIGQGHRKIVCTMYPEMKPPGLDDGSVTCPYFEKGE